MLARPHYRHIQQKHAHSRKHHYYAKPHLNNPQIRVGALFTAAIADHAFPGGCLAVGNAWHIWFNRCYGYHAYDQKEPDTTHSLFDLASLTKVVATTPAIMLLVQAGKIHLDDKVVKYLPDFRGPTAQQTRWKRAITIRDLLTHTSGLPSGDDLDISNSNRHEKWQVVLQTSLLAKRHERYIYSDINFLLLGLIVEKVSGEPLAQFLQQKLFAPLQMRVTFFNPPYFLYPRAVPTVYCVAQHQLLQGEVQDPAARALGGVAGNAGLFSTSGDLARFCQMILRGGMYGGRRILRASILREFTQRANIIANSSRALGWDTAYNPKDPKPHNFTAGSYIDAAAIGHSGYTGTSIWISQTHRIFVILLTNRVEPTITPADTRAEKYWRQRINSAVWQELGFKRQNNLFVEPKPIK